MTNEQIVDLVDLAYKRKLEKKPKCTCKKELRKLLKECTHYGMYDSDNFAEKVIEWLSKR